MAFEHLSDREKKVLFNLVTYYVRSADPVGSRAIAKEFSMGISSATIRNTLQDLEELGLLEQPHTSAGRIPTDLGYRVFVDYLLKPDHLSKKEKATIKQSILKEGRGIKEILGQTCRVLSDIANQLGVSIAPRFDEGIFRRLDLIPLTSDRLMVVVVVQSGLARSVIIEIESSIPDEELRTVEMILNERLSGLSLGEIRTTVNERLKDVRSGKLVNLIVDSRDKIWTEDRAESVLTTGAEHLVAQPEFSNPQDFSALVKLLDGKMISSLLSDFDHEGLVIAIGKENQFSDIMKCSLVTSTYRVGKITGTIGIMGPTRMPYSKLVSLVDYTARTLSDALSYIEGTEEKSNG